MKCQHCKEEIAGRGSLCSLQCALWSGVRMEDVEGKGCWLWQKRVGRDGYPRIKYGSRGQTFPAQRVSWAVAHNIEEFQPLYNACGNRSCVRPDHWTHDSGSRPYPQRRNKRTKAVKRR